MGELKFLFYQVLADDMIVVRSVPVLEHFSRLRLLPRIKLCSPKLLVALTVEKYFWLTFGLPLFLFLVIDASFREDDHVKHAELLIAVFARLVLDVLVVVVIHEAEPLDNWIASHFPLGLRFGMGCVKLLALVLN